MTNEPRTNNITNIILAIAAIVTLGAGFFAGALKVGELLDAVEQMNGNVQKIQVSVEALTTQSSNHDTRLQLLEQAIKH